jgi:hypothetical protein
MLAPYTSEGGNLLRPPIHAMSCIAYALIVVCRVEYASTSRTSSIALRCTACESGAAAPTILGYVGQARTNHRIVGPLAVSCAVIALWEVTRPMRWGNLVLGLWLLIAPWVFTYTGEALLNSTLVGLLLTVFSLIHGQSEPQHVGGGWSALWRPAQTFREQRGGRHE